MAVPYTNTTCDVYRGSNVPPAAPNVAGLACALVPKGASILTSGQYTHLLLVAPNADVRDDYSPGNLAAGPNADRVYIPDRNGTLFRVVLVRRKGRGTALDHKEVLLVRAAGVAWPTDNI
jgi:hypothetical protein